VSAEEAISRTLRTILASQPAGVKLAGSEELREVLVGLEWFLPSVLGEVHKEWADESLDGIYPLFVRKVAEGEVELFGQCILISDQTLVPLHLCLQIDSTKDRVSWLECRLGERGERGMIRTPYESLMKALKRLYALEGRMNEIDWMYKVGFGERK
jgi:hypothetical protein